MASTTQTPAATAAPSTEAAPLHQPAAIQPGSRGLISLGDEIRRPFLVIEVKGDLVNGWVLGVPGDYLSPAVRIDKDGQFRSGIQGIFFASRIAQGTGLAQWQPGGWA